MTRVKKNVTHVIFDVDGTLLDTESCYEKANQAMLAKFGRNFTSEMKANMMGRSGFESNAWLIKEVGISDQITVEEFIAQKDALLAEMFPKCEALPGAERIVRHFAEKGIPMAICSGSCLRKFEQKSAKHRSWLDLIPIKVFCADEVTIKRGKPFPDGFMETMKRFSSPPKDPSHVLVIEDSPNGVQAAMTAGMLCIVVPDPIFREQCRSLNAAQVLSTLEEFRPEEFGLPSFS